MIEKGARKETQKSNSLLKPKRVLTQAARWMRDHSRVGVQNLGVEEARGQTRKRSPRLDAQNSKRHETDAEEGNWVSQGVKGSVARAVMTTRDGGWLME